MSDKFFSLDYYTVCTLFYCIFGIYPFLELTKTSFFNAYRLLCVWYIIAYLANLIYPRFGSLLVFFHYNNPVRNILSHLSVHLYSNIYENFIPTSENVQSKDMNT